MARRWTADDTGFRLRFARALELGGRHTDVGQLPEEEHVVLADPEGNEFCVIEPGKGFLADCGFAGALACDGSRAVGYLCSEALGWPLVRDQGEESAIRLPHGGPELTWGGPPLMPRSGRDRLRVELAATGDLHAEVDRLLSLGATRLGAGEGHDGRVVLADPTATSSASCPWSGGQAASVSAAGSPWTARPCT